MITPAFAFTAGGAVGTVVSIARESLGLLATARIDGVSGTVDLLAPERPISLITHGRQTLPLGRTLAGIAQAICSGGDAEALPAEWVRLCLVSGVDRWLNADLDADLIAADLAAALAQAGDQHGAAELYGRSAPALARVAAGVGPGDGAVLAELDRVVSAALPVPSATDALADVAQVVRRAQARSTEQWTAGWTDWRTAESMLLAAHASGFDAAFVDPLQVAARTLLARPECVIDNDVIRVTAPAFPGVDATSPVAERLLVRAVHIETNSVRVVAPLPFDGSGRFSGLLRLHGADPLDLAVEIVDSLYAGPSRCRAEDRAEVHNLIAAQSAFTSARQAMARSEVAGRPDTDGFRLATFDLDESDARPEATAGFRAAVQNATDAGVPAPLALRPLLAELVAASSR